MAQSPGQRHRLRSPQNFPIGVKIFGIATSLLGLLVFVVAISANRLQRVNREIAALAAYALPITDLVAVIDVHALEQELHFERLQYLYEIDPPPLEIIRIEEEKFESLGDVVDEELHAAIELAKLAIADPKVAENQEEWAKIEPMLEAIEIEHQRFHDHATTILEELEAGDLVTARQLEAEIAVEEEEFNQAINEIFLELEAFTVQAARSGQQHQQTVQTLSIVSAAIATVFGLCYAFVVTVGLVRPVRRLAHSLEAVRQGDLDTQLPVTSRDEVGTLAQSFNAMVQELRLKARLEEAFGKYVDPRIIHNVMDASTDATVAGNRQVMTVFFADILEVGAFVESLPPDALIQFTNAYLSLLSAPVSDHEGVIDKFIGTTVMGFWGHPFSQDHNHGVLACAAALAQREQLATLKQLMGEYAGDRPIPEPTLTVGIATGSLVVGNMGSASAKSFTVMGDVVNTASRLKGATKLYGVPILITADSQAMVADDMETRELDRIQVLGKDDPVSIYELLGRKGTLSDAAKLAYEAFAQGLAAYRQGQWEQAQPHFQACLSHLPSDRPAALFLQRLHTLRQSPPPEDWQGIWQLTEK